MAKSNLTDKQLMFCHEYLKDFNATQAAIRAGYSKKTARQVGSENLSKPNIQDFLNELKHEIHERNEVTIDEVLQELANMMRFDPIDFYGDDGNIRPLQELPPLARRCLTAIDIHSIEDMNTAITTKISKFKYVDKLAVIEKFMRYFGAYEKDNSQKAQATVHIIKLPDNGRG